MRLGLERYGIAGLARRGQVWHDPVWFGIAGLALPGVSGHGAIRSGSEWHRRFGVVGRDAVEYGTVRYRRRRGDWQGTAGTGRARCGIAGEAW